MYCIVLFLNQVFPGQSLQSVLIYTFTNMHAMSYRSDLFACSCSQYLRTRSLLYYNFTFGCVSSRITQHSNSPTMSDSQSLNTPLLEVMISSKNEVVFIGDLNDLTLRNMFDTWRASINICSKWPITWNNSRHAPLWRFYLPSAMAENSSAGIDCIVCPQVLRHSSEHGTSSMGKHLLAKAHIAKLNELRESEGTELSSSTVDETALAILRRQGSRAISIVSSLSQVIFDILVVPY